MRGCFRVLAVVAFATAAFSQNFVDTHGTQHRPFETVAKARVFIFLRTDCPISNRYAPELQRIATEFSSKPVDFWLVYSDRSETAVQINQHIAEYRFPGIPLLDPAHELAGLAAATVTPQAAVFDERGQLKYSGRIDDRWVDFGKSRSAQTHDLEAAIGATLEGRPVSQARTRAVGCYLADVK
ncbi:MAG: redoxin family protein [Acidobacteriaceae bacterium]|nr:redoxin family protein [Acidobacteriaceae bacterium]